MVKKINFILVLLLLLVSVGAVSAADDANNTVGVDEAIDDISDSNEVLTLDVVDEVVSSTSNSYTINESSYSTYFNSKGDASSLVKNGDTINIDGQISNKNFTFKTPVNVIGSNSNNLTNCVFTFYSGASGSNISSLNIANTIKYHYGIFLNGASNCVIKACFVNNTGESSYAVCLGNNANYNNVVDNNFNEYGITYGHGTRSTTPVLLSGSNYNNISNNNISCWDANGIYLSSFSGGPLNGGASYFNVIYNNTIKYLVLPTSWSYGIQIMGGDNIINSNKVIGAYRGISTSGSRNQIINNWIINLTGADFNRPNEEIAGETAIVGSYYSKIINNTIINSKVLASASGISTLDNSIVENNSVQVIYLGTGINPMGSNIIVKNNTISTISGTGILINTHSFNITIDDNSITSQSGVGILIQKISSKRMPGNITIINNVVRAGNSNKIYAIDARDADMSTNNLIEDNYVPTGYGQIATPNGVFDGSKPSYKFKGKTYTISPSTFSDYVETNGFLSSNVTDGDILIFEGVFVNKLNIIVNKAVKIIGNDATFFNTTFKLYSDGVWIENLVIKNSKASKLNAWGVLVYQVFGAKILGCDIEVNDPNAAYAIYVVESTDVDVINNTLFSSGNYLTYTLLGYNVEDCKFINNTIKTNGTGNVYINTGMEACIDGDESCLDGNENCIDGNENCVDGNENCLDGDSFNGNHVVPAEVYRTYGILMLYSSNNIVSGNKINATSKLNKTVNTTESTNSIVGIDLYYNSHNNIFSDNEIYIKSNDNYLYGMGVLGFKSGDDAPEGQGASNNQFNNNTIVLDGTYFVEGFVLGPSSVDTTVDFNRVYAKSYNVNYGINLEKSQKSIINKNTFTLYSDVVFGIESFGSNRNVIDDNDFLINAKQAYGFAFSNSANNEVISNIIFANGTGEAIAFDFHDSIPEGNAGVYLHANSTNNTFLNNNITSSKNYAFIIDDNAINNTFDNNYLKSELGIGNGAINVSSNNTIKYNYVYLIEGKLAEINIKYLENGTFRFTTTNPDLNGALVKFYDFEYNELNSTILSEGIAEFKYHFSYYYPPGTYKVQAEVFKENYKVTKFEADCDIDYGDLNIKVSNSTGPIERNTQFNAILKNILGDGVEGITVKFYVDDEGYEAYIGKAITDSNGFASLNGVIPQIYGDYPTIIAKVEDPTDFNSISGTANLTAFWLTKTNIVLNNNVYPEGVLAILKDQYGNILPNKILSVKIGSSNYNLATNSKGEITMPIISKGNYVISVSFAGDEQYYDSKNSAKVNVLASLSGNSDATVYYGNTITYKVRVKGADGSFSAGKTVTIKVNGQTFKVVSDANGYATKSLKLKTGTYTITAEFNGDKVSNKLTFKPTLTAKNVVKKKAKKIKFSVKVVDKKGKAVKKKKVTFKIKGKKYTAKTNNKGVATVSIKNLKVGKFTITSSYGGCTIKNTIKIKK